MDSKPDVIRLLTQVLDEKGYPVTTGDVFAAIHGVALAAVHSKMPPQGPPGPTGPMGPMGQDGRDAFDKYAWDSDREVLVSSSWKGIKFSFPLDKEFVEAFPTGELNYGDIQFLRTVYGSAVVKRMAMFWRREYDYLTDMQLFIDEEDSCHLLNINKSNSYPARLKD